MENDNSLSKVLFSFQGRVPRSIYWYWFLGYLAVSIAAALLDLALGTMVNSESSTSGVGCISTIVSLAAIIPSLAVSIKRSHDRDHSGWFVLIGLIPLIGSIWLLIELGFLRGTVGPNRFGPDPLQPTQLPPVATPL